MKWLRLNGQTFPLRQGETTIGRSPYCSIQIASHQASREHAAVAIDGDTATISDLDSRNGTYINGVRITQPTRLLSGAMIGIGGVTLSFLEGELSSEPLFMGRTQESVVSGSDLLENTCPTLSESKPNKADQVLPPNDAKVS